MPHRTLRYLALLSCLAAFLSAWLGAAYAQQPVWLCVEIPATAQQGAGVFNCNYVSATNPLPVTTLPPAGVAILGNATGTTGAVVGTLAGVANKTTYICGFSVSAVGTGAVGPITIAGPATSLVFQMTAAAAGLVLNQSFTPCIAASSANTAITTTTTADGSASAVAVNSWGYQQ